MPSRCTNFSDRDRDGRNKNMFDYFDEDDKCPYIQKVNMSADFAFQIKKICGKNA